MLGIDAPAAGDAPNAIVPAARAKISLRVPPGTDAQAAFEALRVHLEKHVEWGARLTVTLEVLGQPNRLPTDGPVIDAAHAALRAAWDGAEPVDMGLGGSIPLVAQLQQRYPDATILVTGAEDPYSSTHSPDESIDLGEFGRICLAEALLLGNLAGLPG